MTGRRPFEVGANLIARTARAALALLQELRELTGESIPLAWIPQLDRLAAIEVYPAATLAARGFPHTGYKPHGQQARREEIVTALTAVMELPGNITTMIGNADALDAAVCALAGWDFLTGGAHSPSHDDEVLAQNEGWIWVRPPPA